MNDGAPAHDEFEVSIFGPGYGEAILVHVGDGQWIAIDSCRDLTTDTIVPLAYLLEIGVDLATQVRCVIATHWHDDHVSGIGELFTAAKAATFCCSVAMRSDEFIKYALAHSDVDPALLQRTTFEMASVIRELRRRGKSPRALGQDQIIFTSSTNATVQAFSLSPVPRMVADFLKDISTRYREISSPATNRTAAQTILRESPFDRNDISVAIYLRLPNGAVLLGADLEETPGGGWSAIVNETQVPWDLATVFKIPHHGSQNGHCNEVWSTLLVSEPIAVLTPWRLASGFLPTSADVQRILGQTAKAFATADPKSRSRIKRAASVDQLLSASNIELELAQPRSGHLRLRRRASESNWAIEMRGTAKHLRNIELPA